MSVRGNRKRLGPVLPVVGSSKYLTPPEIGGRIENFVRTPEGSLRVTAGVAPFMPGYGTASGAPLSSDEAADIGATPADLTYGPMHGIFHTVLASGRDVLLTHTGDQLWEFTGWNRTWRCLVGPASASPQFELTLSDDPRPRWPTQFIGTPNGIIILPWRGLPLYYDGEVVGTLGYPETPGSPELRGPRNPSARVRDDNSGGAAWSRGASTDSQHDVNCVGYAHDGNPKYPWDDTGSYQTQMYPDFGAGRIGSVKSDDFASLAGHGGAIETSAYVGAVQWVDRWGNLSAPSPRSAVVTITQQSSRYDPGDNTEVEHRPDLLLKQLLWTRIPEGPGTTIGKVLLRSKDMLHSGTQDLFEMPAFAGAGSFATLPDNDTVLYPDNIPDSWLVQTAEPVIPVPRGQLGCIAFGCFWLTAIDGDPGAVRRSQPGRWGTFYKDDVWYPDPRARGVTGIAPTIGGLLVFTESSTFILRPAEDSITKFTVSSLSNSVGCAAPDSVRTLPDGRTIWLSYDGFFTFNGENLAFVGDDVAREVRSAARSRLIQATAAVDTESGEYRCWIADDGSMTNDLCLIFDGDGWRRYTLVSAAAVCVTQDHRRYMLMAGRHDTKTLTSNGVWVYDHRHNYYGYGGNASNAHLSRFETAWLGAAEPMRISVPRMVLHLREFSVHTVQAYAYRDWREPGTADAVDAEYVLGHADDDRPGFWGSTLETDGYTWQRRRPYWVSVDFQLPSVEAAKIFLAKPISSRIDILGMAFDVEVKGDERLPNYNRGAAASGGRGTTGVTTPFGPKT